MKNLNFEATEQTLKIDLDYAGKKMCFAGESYPENLWSISNRLCHG